MPTCRGCLQDRDETWSVRGKGKEEGAYQVVSMMTTGLCQAFQPEMRLVAYEGELGVDGVYEKSAAS